MRELHVMMWVEKRDSYSCAGKKILLRVAALSSKAS